ncbi:hypothetical protein G6F35_018105 [Rhizopus arrhizus]|nr:hypothetical protein G6F35_018105 [Rhizopus arrhizus]
MLQSLTSRRGKELFGGRGLDDFAALHEHTAVGHPAGEADLVGDADHGDAGLGQVFHDAQHGTDRFRIQRGRRFVEKHDARPQAERARDGHALLLPAGKLDRILAGLIDHIDLRSEERRVWK